MKWWKNLFLFTIFILLPMIGVHFEKTHPAWLTLHKCYKYILHFFRSSRSSRRSSELSFTINESLELNTMYEYGQAQARANSRRSRPRRRDGEFIFHCGSDFSYFFHSKFRQRGFFLSMHTIFFC